MSQRTSHTLQRLIGTAIVNRHFRSDFLNGGGQELLAQFELNREEREIVLAIEADSLEGFAAELQLRLEADSDKNSRRRRVVGCAEGTALID